MRSYAEEISNGYLVRAGTIGQLAVKLDMNVANLEASVAQMGIASREGVDRAFGKGSTEYNRYLGDASHCPNACLGPMEKSPFFAMRIWPGDIGSAAGLRVDEHARVLNAQERAIKGLYACGNDMNSIMGGLLPAGGITLGPALTFGYIAGKHAASQ